MPSSRTRARRWPLSTDSAHDDSQIWIGQLSNGDWIVGLFNRENEPQRRQIKLNNFGFIAPPHVRDLWAHKDLGRKKAISVTLPPRSCLILRLSQ